MYLPCQLVLHVSECCGLALHNAILADRKAFLHNLNEVHGTASHFEVDCRTGAWSGPFGSPRLPPERDGRWPSPSPRQKISNPVNDRKL